MGKNTTCHHWMTNRDRMSKPVDLRFNRQREVNTAAGGVVTIIFIVIVLLYVGELVLTNIKHHGGEI